MNKLILNKEQVQQLVASNKFRVEDSQKYLSRCIDGRYPNSSKYPLAIPGGDAGEMALIAATSNVYGFTIDLKKAYQSLLDLIGGVQNFNLHTDDHHTDEGIASGCGHMAQMKIDPKEYHLEDPQITEIFDILDKAKKDGANEVILEGAHREGAVLIVKGDYGINSQYTVDIDGKKFFTEVFVYQQTLVDNRHRIWAKALYESQTVKLFDKCDSEYLYEVISEMGEIHLYETAKRLASGLKIFEINFAKNGSFDIIPL